MHLIGLAGPAGAGKDSLAEALARRHGWQAFSFSDGLYREVAEAFSVAEAYLRHRDFKEEPVHHLALRRCADADFVQTMFDGPLRGDPKNAWTRRRPRSPRWTLQRWGTDYRRAQDPEYWVRQADATYREALTAPVWCRVPGLANTSVRFPNEVAWIRSQGGTVVHLSRDGVDHASDYVSERPVPIQEGDIHIANDGDLDDLDRRADELVRALEAQAEESA